MSDATDISSLYQRFGGDADQYLEVGQTNQAQASRERWPLLSAIRPDLAMVPPAVGEPADSPQSVSPWPPTAPVVAPPALPIPSAAAVRVEPWLAPPVLAAQPVQQTEPAQQVPPQAAAAAPPAAAPRPSLQNVFARLAQSSTHSSSKPSQT